MKLFTPEEANAALAVIRPLAERLAESRRKLAGLEAESAAFRGRVAGNGGGIDPAVARELERRLQEANAALAEAAEAIAEVGAQVKDLDVGLLDFPSLHPDGTIVFLCWRLGEDEIAFWHGLDEGFAGRKPLPY